MNQLHVTGIVLAGGRSSRFGADKLAVEVGGRPLLHRAIVAVAQVVDEVVVVIAADGARPRLPGDLDTPLRIARDAAPGLGPLAGLSAGLAAAHAPIALVVGGDQPCLAPILLAELLRWLGSDDDGRRPDVRRPDVRRPDVVCLEEDGRMRPLPSAVRVAAARPAAAAALADGTRSLVGLFEQLRGVTIGQQRWRRLDPAGDSLRDVDTPDDLPPS